MIKAENELDAIHEKISQLLPTGGIVLLKGDLASGKTTLVQSFVRFLGLDVEATSPTFSIMNVYDNRVYHYDIYNEGTKKFVESGLLENLENRGYHFIEWADEKLEALLSAYGFDTIMIEIAPKGALREYTIHAA
jgi:tRNA threonylcarbamoyladenosine biosynthesis protein TsaE